MSIDQLDGFPTSLSSGRASGLGTPTHHQHACLFMCFGNIMIIVKTNIGNIWSVMSFSIEQLLNFVYYRLSLLCVSKRPSIFHIPQIYVAHKLPIVLPFGISRAQYMYKWLFCFTLYFWLMVNCAVYRFHNIPMKTALHGENMKSSDVHSPVEVLGFSLSWLLTHGIFFS